MSKDFDPKVPSIIVFPGRPAFFQSYDEAEEYAKRLVERDEFDVRHATILPNTTEGRSVMESALVVVNPPTVAVTVEEALKQYGYEGEEEDW